MLVVREIDNGCTNPFVSFLISCKTEMISLDYGKLEVIFNNKQLEVIFNNKQLKRTNNFFFKKKQMKFQKKKVKQKI
jgi:hypothetical protein